MLPDVTLEGTRFPFLVRCHSLDNSGNMVENELVTETSYPAQKGHPAPCLVLVEIPEVHSWSGPFSHFHQYPFLLNATTLSGLASAFLVGCHCLAISGKILESVLVTDKRLLEQNGHPEFLPVRLAVVACQMWSGPLAHFHQYFLELAGLT